MIIVTGASSGIGQALYSYFLKSGEYVVGVSRRGPDLCLDLSNPKDTFKLKGWIVSNDEKVDCLINNAGVMLFENVCSSLEIQSMVQLNLVTIDSLHRLIFPHMRMGVGSIINIASSAGITAEAEMPLYSAIKAGIHVMTRAYAKLFAPGIRVNCISPGLFDTNLVEGDTPQDLINAVPLKRIGQPEEIVPVVDLLLKCKYMTGANLIIDGGLCA